MAFTVRKLQHALSLCRLLILNKLDTSTMLVKQAGLIRSIEKYLHMMNRLGKPVWFELRSTHEPLIARNSRLVIGLALRNCRRPVNRKGPNPIRLNSLDIID